MINEKIRNKIAEYCKEENIEIELFNFPALDNSILGFSNDKRAIYSYNKMINEFAKDNQCSCEVAIDIIELNIIAPYRFHANAPIILQDELPEV